MTWTQIDDGLNFSPQTMPGTVSNAALGLWVRLCVHTAYQLRFPAFDGAFDLTVVRSLKGNARQVTELEAAGMLEPALAAGRWMVVEADTLMKFGGTSGSELRRKGPRPGMPAASLRARLDEANAKQMLRSKTKQVLQANHEARPKQTMKQTVKQTMKQNRSKRPKQNEAIASKQTKQPVLT